MSEGVTLAGCVVLCFANSPTPQGPRVVGVDAQELLQTVPRPSGVLGFRSLDTTWE